MIYETNGTRTTAASIGVLRRGCLHLEEVLTGYIARGTTRLMFRLIFSEVVTILVEDTSIERGKP